MYTLMFESLDTGGTNDNCHYRFLTALVTNYLCGAFPLVDFLSVCLVCAIDDLRNYRRSKGSSAGYIFFFFENSVNIRDI